MPSSDLGNVSSFAMAWISLIALLVLLSLTSEVLAACPSNCHWNGRCTHDKCACLEGFYGADCHGDCGCQGHGVCNPDNTCNCDEGWKWDAQHQQCVWDCHCQQGVACIGPGECGCQPVCKSGDCRQSQCVCWEGYKGEDCSTLDKNMMMNKGVNVGMNLGGISYYSAEVKFVDIAKQSEEWITQRESVSSWNTHEADKLHLRPDGYPSMLEGDMHVAKLMYRDYGPHMQPGDYTILYEGDGEISFKLIHGNIKYNGKGRMVVNFPKINSGGIGLVVSNVNPANPIHNIRVIAPGYENLYERFPFHPVFLENLRRYSELRFMDFLSTNGHTPEPTTWASRRLPDYHTQSGSEGAAIEYMIKVANVLGANPWFCTPHAADDDYVRKFAQMVKKDLRPDLKVYLEYSNEVWNNMFRQTHYAREQGMKLHLDTDSNTAGIKYYNQRAMEIIDIWTQVFGADSDRLYPIWSEQTNNQYRYEKALTDLGSGVKKFKALAITGYISCDSIANKHAAEMENMSMAQIGAFCLSMQNQSESKFQYYAQLAKQHGVQLVMYEGGPGIVESSGLHHGATHGNVTAKAIAFNLDPHVEPVVSGVLEAWNSIVSSHNPSPGGLFNYFAYTGAPTKYGSWGMLQYTGQDPSTVPKSLAVQKFITKHFSDNPLGPRCSFVEDGAIAYGCFHVKGGNFRCGMSDDKGRTWNYFSDPTNVQNGDYLILDGYNPSSHTVSVRHVDKILTTSYHEYNINTKHWSKPSNFDYYTGAVGAGVLPRFPNGVYHGLDNQAQCS